MIRKKIGRSVFDAAIDRIVEKYEEGERIVVATSGGKDSTVALEMTIIAAKRAGTLPVECVFRDVEIMPPGTHEWIARTAERKDVSMKWLYALLYQGNAFSRAHPVWWTFDPLHKDLWVTTPPKWAEWREELTCDAMIREEDYWPGEDHNVFAVQGCRVQESRIRKMTVANWLGAEAPKSSWYGACSLWPIYDWSDSDVWKAILENNWYYNSAYDKLFQVNCPRARMRISDFSLNAPAAEQTYYLAKAFPEWMERCELRVPGTSLAKQYGREVCLPKRKLGETWQQCFNRTCIDEAPDWMKPRSHTAMMKALAQHKRHSTAPLPDAGECTACKSGSWKVLARNMYLGDPIGVISGLPRMNLEAWRAQYVEKIESERAQPQRKGKVA